MATSKVPKFGAWEGGDNFTVYFENARKIKNNGPRINPNDPEENPDMFQPRPGPTQAQPQPQAQAQAQTSTIPNRADNQRKQTKVPHFGAWEDEESDGYTVCFENVQKAKNGRPLVTDNEPQMNRDVPNRPDSRVNAQTPVNALTPVQTRAHGQGQAQAQARPKVPQFGDWEREGGGGQGNYTVAFDNLKKKNGRKSNTPQSNRDVEPAPQVGRAKVPEFGAWEAGEAVQYTAYFDNAKKNKNAGPGMNSNEPQMNRNVADRARVPPVAVAKVEPKDDVLRNSNQGSTHPNANLQPRGNAGGGRGNPTGSIPPFGGWNSDRPQADDYTGDFAKEAKEDRRTPLHNNVPPARQPYNPQALYHNNQKQPSCCTIL